MNSFECPNCKESLELEDDMLGQEGICPYCDATIQIPGKEKSSSKAPQLSVSKPRSKRCPNCSVSMQPDAVLCIQCGHDLRTGQSTAQEKSANRRPGGSQADNRPGSGGSNDSGYNPPKIQAPGATASLVCGIISLCIVTLACCPFVGVFGIILGIISIYQGYSARKLCAQNDRFVGDGMALSGIILGIIGTLLCSIASLLGLLSIVMDSSNI